jgi:hypothetical protein
MAKLTPSTVCLEVNGSELDIIIRALRVMDTYGEYNDDVDRTALAQLREDLSNG